MQLKDNRMGAAIGVALIVIASLLWIDLYLHSEFFNESVLLPIQASSALGLSFVGAKLIPARNMLRKLGTSRR